MIFFPIIFNPFRAKERRHKPETCEIQPNSSQNFKKKKNRHSTSLYLHIRKDKDRIFTVNGGAEEDQAVVQVLAVTLQSDLGIVGEFEVEGVAARLEGAEVEGVGGLEGEVVEQD